MIKGITELKEESPSSICRPENNKLSICNILILKIHCYLKVSLGKSWRFTEECEGAGLESLCTVKGTVGSNPTLSAISLMFQLINLIFHTQF